MTKLKLTRGKSYLGYGVIVSADKRVIEVADAGLVETLLATKRFEVVSQTDEKPAKLPKTGKNTPKDGENDPFAGMP